MSQWNDQPDDERGSGGIAFTPVGENTAITVAGAWPDPSFQGNLLPVERNITDKGFSARWNISNLTRTYPQIEDTNSPDSARELESIRRFTAGVDLHETVSLYRMVRRAVHYGILFIAVSFVALFAFEMVTRQRMRHHGRQDVVFLGRCLAADRSHDLHHCSCLPGTGSRLAPLRCLPQFGWSGILWCPKRFSPSLQH